MSTGLLNLNFDIPTRGILNRWVMIMHCGLSVGPRNIHITRNICYGERLEHLRMFLFIRDAALMLRGHSLGEITG
jgi:hypothetical protein